MKCKRDPECSREERTVSASLLAFVQGDEAEAKRLLKIDPGLLRMTKGEVTDYSMRLIKGLTPFQVALCAGDVEMCEMMKSYFAQLQDGQAEISIQFNAIFPHGVEAYVKMQQDNVFDFNETIQAFIHAQGDDVTSAFNKAFDNT